MVERARLRPEPVYFSVGLRNLEHNDGMIIYRERKVIAEAMWRRGGVTKQQLANILRELAQDIEDYND
jgi:hypothetical protein